MTFFNFRAIVAIVLCLVVLAFSVPLERRKVMLGQDILTSLNVLISQASSLLVIAQSIQGTGIAQLSLIAAGVSQLVTSMTILAGGLASSALQVNTAELILVGNAAQQLSNEVGALAYALGGFVGAGLLTELTSLAQNILVTVTAILVLE